MQLLKVFRPYTTWLDFILDQTNPPVTISTSYGDDEQTGMFYSFFHQQCLINALQFPRALLNAFVQDSHNSVRKY